MQESAYVPRPLWPQGSFLAHVPDQTWRMLQAAGKYCKFETDALLYCRSEIATNVMVVTQGTVALFKQYPGDQLVGVRCRGDLAGEREVLQRAQRNTGFKWGTPGYRETAVAITPVTVLRIEAFAFNDLAEGRPELWRALMEVLHQRLDGIEGNHLREGSLSASQKLAHALLELWPRGERSSAQEEFRLTQAQLASWIGVSRDSIERTLRGWRARGLVETSYRKIKVCKKDALQKMARDTQAPSIRVDKLPRVA